MAAQPGSPPASVYSACRLVMKSRNVDGHSLEQQSGSLSQRFIATEGEFVEKLLMAIDGPVWPSRAKLVREKSRLAQKLDYNPPCPTATDGFWFSTGCSM